MEDDERSRLADLSRRKSLGGSAEAFQEKLYKRLQALQESQEANNNNESHQDQKEPSIIRLQSLQDGMEGVMDLSLKRNKPARAAVFAPAPEGASKVGFFAENAVIRKDGKEDSQYYVQLTVMKSPASVSERRLCLSLHQTTTNEMSFKVTTITDISFLGERSLDLEGRRVRVKDAFTTLEVTMLDEGVALWLYQALGGETPLNEFPPHSSTRKRRGGRADSNDIPSKKKCTYCLTGTLAPAWSSVHA